MSAGRRTYSIAVIPGDGIGPEVIVQGTAVLRSAAAASGFDLEFDVYPWGSDLYLRTGQLMTDSDLDDLRRHDAIYLGAVGDPRVEPGLVERSVIMTIRLGLDLYINLRPINLWAERLTPLKRAGPEDIDMVVVRENTEDAYVGLGGSMRRGTIDEVSIAEMIYTRRGVERTVRYAFELARSRTRKRLTLIDKSNAIRAQDIWRRTLAEVGEEYPEVETEAVYVDAAVMYMVDDPARFDVIVTTNLFGDIITDLGASIQGGVGSAASGNIHPGATSMFEPIHGSAPNIAGQGIASPIGAITAGAMLLHHLGELDAAAAIEQAVGRLVVAGDIPTLDARSGKSTAEIGALVVEAMKQAGG